MKKSVRTTISIPAALKARMDAVGEETNWSAIAAQAFKAKLAEVITRKGVKDMKDVIARLKASKVKSFDESTEKSRAEGRRWAMEEAEAVYLSRLSDEKARDPWDWGAMFNTPMNDPYTRSVIIMRGLGPDESDDAQQEGRAFWARFLGENFGTSHEEVAFVEGFLDGAIDLWDEIKNQV